MPRYHLSERLQAVRDSLTQAELNFLCQERIDQNAAAVYQQGWQDGRAKLLKEQQASRETRKSGRRRRVWATAVYFIRSPQGIKIGMSNNPEGRLRVLQTGHTEPLELLAFTEGGKDLEREYHTRFAAHRLAGEWFAPHPDILAEIERVGFPFP